MQSIKLYAQQLFANKRRLPGNYASLGVILSFLSLKELNDVMISASPENKLTLETIRRKDTAYSLVLFSQKARLENKALLCKRKRSCTLNHDRIDTPPGEKRLKPNNNIKKG